MASFVTLRQMFQNVIWPPSCDRLDMERRKKEQQEKEAYEARIKEERQIREVQLCRTHCERSAALLTLCTGSLASWAIQHWQLKQVGAVV